MQACCTFAYGDGVGVLIDGVRSLCMSIQLRSSRVIRCPESFTIERDISTIVMLFLSIIQDRDAVSQEYEGDDVLGFRVVTCVAVWELCMMRKIFPIFGLVGDLLGKSWVVMVLDEVSEERCVGAIGFDGIDHII